MCKILSWVLHLWHKLWSMRLCNRKSTGYYGDGAYHVFKNVTSHAVFFTEPALRGFNHHKYKDEWHSLGIAPEAVAMLRYSESDKRAVFDMYIFKFLIKEEYIEELADGKGFKLTEKGRVAQAIGSHEDYVKYYTRFQRSVLKQPGFNYYTRLVTWILSIVSIIVSGSVTFYKIWEIEKIKNNIEKLKISDSLQQLIISGEVTILPSAKDSDSSHSQKAGNNTTNHKSDSTGH